MHMLPAALAALAAATLAVVPGTPAHDVLHAPGSKAAKIASARSAGPASITKNATIAEVGTGGKLTTLREGSNGWLCLPDNPGTPGPDPMCVDKVWQDWMGAYMAKQQPTVKQIGIAYMLAGGTDASNDDPYATKPAAGAKWVKSAPHMMVLLPDPSQLDSYPNDPNSGGPFVMWKGTPYAHLMVPAKR